MKNKTLIQDSTYSSELQEMIYDLFKKEDQAKIVEHDKTELLDMIDNYNN